MIDANTRILLHLSLISGIGPKTILTIVETIKNKGGALASLYSLKAHDIANTFLISLSQSQKIVEGLSNQKILEQELHYITQNNANIISILDSKYPDLLKHIHVPPPLLYYQGILPEHDNCIAFVGSRDCDEYGASIATELVSEISSHQWVIVSGGARGIDTISHQAALAATGTTIAILGSGLLHTYPKENVGLFKKIVEQGGALCTPFSMNTPPHKGNFPIRNRIIAGLSKACVVVQATEKSGALISAHCALEEGRDVFAVPGAISNPRSAGCHYLIKQGATLVHSTNDIFETLGILKCEKEEKINDNSYKSDIIQINEHPIVLFLNVPRSIDEMTSHFSLPLSEIQMQLFDLQIEGKIKQNFTGLWERS